MAGCSGKTVNLGKSMLMCSNKYTFLTNQDKYDIDFYGFDFSENMCGYDFAYVRIYHNGICYHNIDNAHGNYPRFEYVLNNDAIYRKNGHSARKVLIENISAVDDTLVVSVAEELNKYTLKFTKITFT